MNKWIWYFGGAVFLGIYVYNAVWNGCLYNPRGVTCASWQQLKDSGWKLVPVAVAGLAMGYWEVYGGENR